MNCILKFPSDRLRDEFVESLRTQQLLSNVELQHSRVMPHLLVRNATARDIERLQQLIRGKGELFEDHQLKTFA